MKRLTLIVIVLLIAISFAMPDYYVLNGLGETLSLGRWMEAPANDLITTGSMPNQIYTDADGYVWVIASGAASIQKFEVVDGDFALLDEYFLPMGSNPYLMHFANGKCYVSLWVTGNFAVIDLGTGSIDVYESGLLGAQGIFADDEYIYITAGNYDPGTYTYGDGELYRFDHEGNPEGMINVGTNPQQIISVINPLDGKRYLNIACTGDYMSVMGSVYQIDPEAFEVTDSVLIGGSPARLAYDSLNAIGYAVTSVWGESGSGRLLAYDISSFVPLWTADDTDNALSGTGLTGLDIYQGYIYIASMDSSTVEIVKRNSETSDLEHLRLFTTGYGTQDIAIQKINDGLEEHKGEVYFTDINAYPNPFRRACNFESDALAGHIEIFSLNGKLVGSVESGQVWRPGKDIDTGVYMARINDDGKTAQKRIVYIK